MLFIKKDSFVAVEIVGQLDRIALKSRGIRYKCKVQRFSTGKETRDHFLNECQWRRGFTTPNEPLSWKNSLFNKLTVYQLISNMMPSNIHWQHKKLGFGLEQVSKTKTFLYIDWCFCIYMSSVLKVHVQIHMLTCNIPKTMHYFVRF